MHRFRLSAIVAVAAALAPLSPAHADENLFGYVKGAEPLPRGAVELYQLVTSRFDKGSGSYQAWDFSTELERGFTDRLAGALYVNAMSLDTSGLTIDGYLPRANDFGVRLSGFEGELRYNVLSPARSAAGLTLYSALVYSRIDPHSGQDKDTLSFEQKLLLQKYFLDGQVIWAGNLGLEATRARRAPLQGLPPDFDWPTDPEMEIELDVGSGVSWRFAPNWFAGLEALYVQENETEVGLERWSLQAGPSLHFGGSRWWGTLTWLEQVRGGGERYPGQPDRHLHLIEKTRHEARLKIGYNF